MTLNASKIKTVVTVLSQDYTPRLTLENPEMKALLKSNKQFDVVVLDAMLCESLLAIGHFFNAPTVVASSFGSNSGAGTIGIFQIFTSTFLLLLQFSLMR